jgi:hypothetical protein
MSKNSCGLQIAVLFQDGVHPLNRGTILARDLGGVSHRMPILELANNVGLVDVATVDVAASFEKPKDPLQVKADGLGITVEQLLERIAKMD